MTARKHTSANAEWSILEPVGERFFEVLCNCILISGARSSINGPSFNAYESLAWMIAMRKTGITSLISLLFEFFLGLFILGTVGIRKSSVLTGM